MRNWQPKATGGGHIGKEKFYTRTDLIPQNSSWVSPLVEGKDLAAYYNDIARMVKEKTGRAMQTKERIVIDNKTDKTKGYQWQFSASEERGGMQIRHYH